MVIELNLRHRDGLEGAAEQFLAHFRATMPDAAGPPDRVADTYFRCALTEAEILRLVEADQRQEDAARRAIYRVWPDFPVHPLIDTSCATVKADAARRSFDATGRGITWAVLDSGIDADHPTSAATRPSRATWPTCTATSPSRASRPSTTP